MWHVSDFKVSYITLLCVRRTVVDEYMQLPEVDPASYKAQGELPKCPKCQRIARPNVLMFGDLGFSKQREAVQVENYHKWLKTIDKPTAKFVIIGTTK